VAEPGWLIEGGFVRRRNFAGIFRKSISRSQGGVQSLGWSAGCTVRKSEIENLL